MQASVCLSKKPPPDAPEGDRCVSFQKSSSVMEGCKGVAEDEFVEPDCAKNFGFDVLKVTAGGRE